MTKTQSYCVDSMVNTHYHSFGEQVRYDTLHRPVTKPQSYCVDSVVNTHYHSFGEKVRYDTLHQPATKPQSYGVDTVVNTHYHINIALVSRSDMIRFIGL